MTWEFVAQFCTGVAVSVACIVIGAIVVIGFVDWLDR